ncbi:MAG: M23 family metallopeptidase [Flavobacteriaceae bacterium]
MKKTIANILCFLIILPLFAQKEYPKEYFGNPLEIGPILAGTFAELRSNHFHGGVDIKTQQREGLNVLATADGYISRIKISPWGYGKAIYIQHPNGYTTVYGHLKELAPEFESYVKERQYKKEKFAIELFPSENTLKVTKGQLIGLSGNTGGSGGPHLHYEIRDSRQHPMNPMLFGFNVKDSRKPTINAVYGYSLTDSSQVNHHNNKVKLKLIKGDDGNYIAETVYASGVISFGINTYDKQDLAHNKNGVYNIKTYINGKLNYELDFKKFSFKESRHLNQLIDYAYFKKKKSRIQKLFKTPSNPLSIIKNVEDYGQVIINEGEQINYKIIIADYNNNKRTVTIPIVGQKKAITHFKEKIESPQYVYADKELLLEDNDKQVYIPKNALYEDTPIVFETKGDTIIIGDTNIPLHKNITLKFDVEKFSEDDLSKMYISGLGYNNKPYFHVNTTLKHDKMVGKTKSFGKFTLSSDTEKPIITPVNTQNGKWMSKSNFLKMKISDKLSGIDKYRATINGKWALMEYDPKKDLLSYKFSDKIHQPGENKFKLIVIDNVGNNSTFEMTFFRNN